MNLNAHFLRYDQVVGKTSGIERNMDYIWREMGCSLYRWYCQNEDYRTIVSYPNWRDLAENVPSEVSQVPGFLYLGRTGVSLYSTLYSCHFKIYIIEKIYCYISKNILYHLLNKTRCFRNIHYKNMKMFPLDLKNYLFNPVWKSHIALL